MSNEGSSTLHFLVELRRRLIYSLSVLCVLFSVLLYFSNELYTFLAQPLLKFLPQGHLIAIQIASPFFVPFKLSFLAAMFLAAPFFLYQLWRFIAPALYGHERRLLWPFLLMSTFLFYAGLAFAYFIIFPMLFHFLAGTAPQGVTLAPDINEYLDFTAKILIVFGVLFEIPMIMLLLVSAGIVSKQRLIKGRGYAVLGAFIAGMFLAPPDVLSQTLLAIPIWLLYEGGILLCNVVRTSSNEKTQSKTNKTV